MKISRRTWMKTASAAAAGLLAKPSVAQTGERPNIVFILIDDMGWKDVEFMGSCFYETPNIDRLAKQGMTFTNAYANAPNCAPTRACLMSGQYSPRHGIYTVSTAFRGKSEDRKLIPIETKQKLPLDCVTYAEALQKNGYATGHFGKWHLPKWHRSEEHNPDHQGFGVAKGRRELGFEGYHFARKDYKKDPEPEYLTDRLTEEACDFMRQNKDRPFLVNLWHHAVHVPVQAKQKMIEKYKDKEPCGGHFDPEYAAMVESVDQSVGSVMQTLDELGLTENTMVLFFSDNGGYGPITTMDPLRGAKGMLYEGGIRVPMVVRWPDTVKAGSVCEEPVIGTDFYTTFLEMSGTGRPNQPLDGHSLMPLLEQKGTLNRDAIHWHFPCYLEAYKKNVGPWRTAPAAAVRKGDYKLIEFFEDGKLELYNLNNDIGETNNLLRQMPDKVEELHQEMKAWRERMNAPVPTKRNPEYKGTK